MDTNVVERAIRPITITRKNSYSPVPSLEPVVGRSPTP
jgi:hypothetical protein